MSSKATQGSPSTWRMAQDLGKSIGAYAKETTMSLVTGRREVSSQRPESSRVQQQRPHTAGTSYVSASARFSATSAGGSGHLRDAEEINEYWRALIRDAVSKDDNLRQGIRHARQSSSREDVGALVDDIIQVIVQPKAEIERFRIDHKRYGAHSDLAALRTLVRNEILLRRSSATQHGQTDAHIARQTDIRSNLKSLEPNVYSEKTDFSLGSYQNKAEWRVLIALVLQSIQNINRRLTDWSGKKEDASLVADVVDAIQPLLPEDQRYAMTDEQLNLLCEMIVKEICSRADETVDTSL